FWRRAWKPERANRERRSTTRGSSLAAKARCACCGCSALGRRRWISPNSRADAVSGAARGCHSGERGPRKRGPSLVVAVRPPICCDAAILHEEASMSQGVAPSLSIFEIPAFLVEPALRSFRLSNAVLDMFFYDTGVLMTELLWRGELV